MKLRLILDDSGHWMVSFEVTEEEKRKILGNQKTLKVTSNLTLADRKPHLIMGSSNYASLINYSDFLVFCNLFVEKGIITPEEKNSFSQIFDEFKSFDDKMRNLIVRTPKQHLLRDVLNHNNSDVVIAEHEKVVKRLKNIYQEFELLDSEVERNKNLSEETKTYFHKIVAGKLQSINEIEKTLKENVDIKIQYLNKDPNYIENVDKEKQFKHIIKNLKPLESRDKLLAKFLLNEKVAQGRYRIKGKQLEEETDLGTGPQIVGITLYRKHGEDLEETPANLIYDDASESTLFEVEYSTGEKRFYQLNSYIVSSQALAEIFKSHGATIDVSSVSRGVGPLREGFFSEGLSGYTREIELDYETIHKKITEQFAKNLGEVKTIEVVFVGCGKGEEIKPIMKILEQNNIPYVIYAIDIDEGNIRIASKQPEFQNKPVYFKAGNANQIDQFITEAREKNKKFYKSQPHTIAIASGCLTRHVNSDQTEAFDIFKKTGHFVDEIIISGRTSTLITRRDAKKAGFADEQTKYTSPENSTKSFLRTLDVYTFKPLTDQANVLVGQQSNLIDLTEHARPFELLLKIAELTKKKNDFWKNKTINVNDAYIHSRDIKDFAKFIYKNDLTVMVNGREPWFNDFETELDKLNKRKLEIFKSTKRGDIKFTEPTPLTQFEHEDRKIYERPKISERLRKRAMDSLGSEEDKTKKKFP